MQHDRLYLKNSKECEISEGDAYFKKLISVVVAIGCVPKV